MRGHGVLRQRRGAAARLLHAAVRTAVGRLPRLLLPCRNRRDPLRQPLSLKEPEAHLWNRCSKEPGMPLRTDLRCTRRMARAGGQCLFGLCTQAGQSCQHTRSFLASQRRVWPASPHDCEQGSLTGNTLFGLPYSACRPASLCGLHTCTGVSQSSAAATVPWLVVKLH